MRQIHARIEKNFKNFCLQVEIHTPGKVLGILGQSGCGKSMTLRALSGIITPDEGRIAIGERIVYDSDKKINAAPRERKIGYLFQNYALFPNMTVEQNIAIVANGERALVKDLIHTFHLDGLEKMYPARLSGGQQQRTALARILASAPEALLLDEPFSAMDSFLKEELQLELKERLCHFDGPVMIVSHDRDELYRLCDHVLVMSKGRSLICKETRSLFAAPEKMEAARLTGCKNISHAVQSGEHEVEALDWGVTFHIKKKIPEGLKFIGIRAHDFLPDGETGPLKVQVTDITDSPFERIILFKNADNPKGNMWIKMKDKNAPIPQTVRVSEEKILLLE